MKMAKASEKDIKVAGDVMAIFDQIDRGDYPFEEGDENVPDYFEPDNYNHLRHFYDLIKSSLDNEPNWHGRVIGGMCYVILWDKNEIVDPASDTLDLHPKFQRMSDERDKACDLLKEIAGQSRAISPSNIDLLARIDGFVKEIAA